MTDPFAAFDAFQRWSLEEILTRSDLFGLAASPVQRAICRVLSGEPAGDLAAEVAQVCGGVAQVGRPQEALILAAIRCGKSLIAAAAAVESALYADLSRLGPGEVARVSVVAPRMDLAQVIREHLVGRIQASDILRARLCAEPTAGAVMLRNQSGRPVEIKIVAGARAGTTLVARWSAGAIFDEAARMVGDADGVVNVTHARQAVRQRLLPGARILYVTSPWAAVGPVHQWYSERYGERARPDGPVVLRADGPAMRPDYWTPARCAEAQAADDLSYRTDVLCEFAASADDALLSPEEINRARRNRREQTIPPHPLGHYTAAIDPATRRNAWTLTVLTREGPRLRVALHNQWLPGAAPLDPSRVFSEIKTLVAPYGVTTLHSDQWSGDALDAVAVRSGLSLSICHRSAEEISADYRQLAEDIRSGTFELPHDPQVGEDLGAMRRRLTASGVRVYLATSGSGRHADYAPALSLARRIGVADRSAVVAERDPVEAQLLRELAGRERDARDLGIH